MPIYNSSKRSEQDLWMTILWRDEVSGECQKCKSGHRALWTIYGDRSENIRCLKCKTVGQFLIDPNIFDDPGHYPPLRGDEIEEKKSAWDSRYSKGMRY